MVQGHWFPIGADLSAVLDVRARVFGRGRDALDACSQQVAVYDGGEAVGAARLWWQDGAFRLGDVGVLEDRRGRGFGDLLVRLCLFKALTHGATEIRLTSPGETEPFFAKYGFRPDGGDMAIRAEDVRLSHCGGNCAECGHPSEACVPKALR